MKLFLFTLLISSLFLASCGETQVEENKEAEAVVKAEEPAMEKPAGEPDRVVVQHILIAFKGKIPGENRSQDQAQQLAEELFQKAQAGEDYDALVKANTNDQFPGRYAMVNFGVVSNSPGDIPRKGLVGSFGDIGFKLAVGEIGLAEYDEKTSPYGWHIIKRVE